MCSLYMCLNSLNWPVSNKTLSISKTDQCPNYGFLFFLRNLLENLILKVYIPKKKNVKFYYLIIKIRHFV